MKYFKKLSLISFIIAFSFIFGSTNGYSKIEKVQTQNSNCQPRAEVIKKITANPLYLSQKFAAIIDNKTILELYANSDSKIWVLFRTKILNNNKFESCLLTTGTDYLLIDGQIPGTPS